MSLSAWVPSSNINPRRRQAAAWSFSQAALKDFAAWAVSPRSKLATPSLKCCSGVFSMESNATTPAPTAPRHPIARSPARTRAPTTQGVAEPPWFEGAATGTEAGVGGGAT